MRAKGLYEAALLILIGAVSVVLVLLGAAVMYCSAGNCGMVNISNNALMWGAVMYLTGCYTLTRIFEGKV